MKKLIGGLIIVAILGLGYWYFMMGGGNEINGMNKNDSANAGESVYRIGFVGTSPIISSTFDGFQESFSLRMSTEGKQIEYYRNMVPYSTLNIENAIKDLLDKKVDIIFTGMSEMKIARALAGDTPIIVMAGGVNQLGLVRPDGTSGENVAYVDTTNPDTAGDRLRKFGELAPNLKRIAVFRGIEGTPGEYGLAMADMQAVAKELGLTLTDKQFADRKEFNKYMIEEANFTEVDAIFRYPSPFIATNVDIIFAFRATIDLPIVGLNKQELTQGALMAYGPDYEEIGALASEIAYEILVDGKNAGEIVYKKPSRMYLGINEEDAIRHNLVIPQSISSKIDYRIEN